MPGAGSCLNKQPATSNKQPDFLVSPVFTVLILKDIDIAPVPERINNPLLHRISHCTTRFIKMKAVIKAAISGYSEYLREKMIDLVLFHVYHSKTPSAG